MQIQKNINILYNITLNIFHIKILVIRIQLFLIENLKIFIDYIIKICVKKLYFLKEKSIQKHVKASY